jgi:hypothetical protein
MKEVPCAAWCRDLGGHELTAATELDGAGARAKDVVDDAVAAQTADAGVGAVHHTANTPGRDRWLARGRLKSR